MTIFNNCHINVCTTQSLLLTEVLITPIVLIKSFEKVLSSCFSGDYTQKLSRQSHTTAFARLLLMMVQTLPESTNAFVMLFPMQMLTFTGSTSLKLSLWRLLQHNCHQSHHNQNRSLHRRYCVFEAIYQYD